MANIQKRQGKNGISYRAQVRMKGYPAQQKSFARLTDAKIWAQQTEVAIRKGEFQSLVKPIASKTLKDLIKRYKEEVLPDKQAGTIRSEVSHLAFWQEVFGNYDLIRITSAMIGEELRKLSKSISRATGKPRSKRTVKYYRDTLSFIFKCAKQWGWATYNPLDDVAPITKLKNERVRFLSDAEREALLCACKAHPNKQLYPIVVMALATGARQGEIMKLELKDVNLVTGKTILRDTKNGETRSVPLVNYALDVIKDQAEYAERLYFDLLKSDGPKYLFPRSDGQEPLFFRKAWYQALETSGVTDFKFHDLRHSAASYLAMNGASLLEIADILGHKTLQMVKRYSHLSEDHTRTVLEKMNNGIFGT